MIRDNSNLEIQQLQIAINSRASADGSTSVDGSGVLPYDPANAPDDDTTTVILAQNSLDNSDFDYSKLDYTGAGAGDDAYECYNFYRQRFIKVTDLATTAASNVVTSASNPFKSTYTYPVPFVLYNGGASGATLRGFINRNGADGSAKLYTDAGMGTPLNVTSTLANATIWFGTAIAENSTNAVKSSAHSTYAANEGTNSAIPDWDRTAGWIETGSNSADRFDVATPLPINLIRAGIDFYFRCIISQKSGTSGSSTVRISAGIWDATSGNEGWLEASNLSLSVSPVPSAGGTTYSYVVLAYLDDGRIVMSNTVTIATGPAALSQTTYNRLEWQNVTGVNKFEIYRQKGAAVARIFTITNGEHAYNDYGTNEAVVGSLPTAAEERNLAYAVSPQFDPADLGVGSWMAVLIRIPIPETYNSSSTTGKQWLRVQIEGQVADVRMVLSDRWCLSTSNGGWNRSARDLNRIQTGNPSSLPPSGGGQGGGGIGEGGCFVLATPIIRCERDGTRRREVPIGSISVHDITAGCYVLSANRVRRVSRTSDKKTRLLIRCRLSNGVGWLCSRTQKFVTSSSDQKGTRIDALTEGDSISGWQRRRIRPTYLAVYEPIELSEPVTVRTLHLVGGKTYLVGRLTGWRKKIENAKNWLREKRGLEPEFTKAVGHNEKPLFIE